MISTKFLCIIPVIVFMVVADDLTTEEIQTVLEQFNTKEDKREFIRYHLNRGYELQDNQTSLYTKESPQFSMKFYNYFMTNNQITDQSRIAAIMDTVCFPAGCIDIDDPGVNP